MLVEVRRDQVRPGESWAEAADRLVPTERQTHGPVLAVDLSGDPLVFGLDADHVFSVRAMTPATFPT